MPVIDLADGEWHRLHPATPFLRGGIVLIAIVGFIAVQLRDILVNLLLGDGPDGQDPVVWLGEHGGWFVLLGILGAAFVLVGGFYLSWRRNEFRVSDEVVEVRRGIIVRSHRRARLDRVQGVSVQRPFLARLFGSARLEVDVAGQNANVRLEYLGGAAADALRRDILLLASGAQAHGVTDGLAGSRVERRFAELLAPELDPALAPPQSVVALHPGRLVGSVLLSGSLVWLIVFTVGPVLAFGGGRPVAAIAVFIPAIIAIGGYIIRRVTHSLRYTIAATDDGIRVGFGLFSTSNETLPPGRIHAIEVSQPLLWRVPGWWRIRINRASMSRQRSAQATTTVLPVGDASDVARVLRLMLPAGAERTHDVIARGLVSRGGDDGFVNSPPRARVLRWFSRRRNGFAVVEGLALLRRGAVLRSLTIVPLARVQSTSLEQGPLERWLRLAKVRLHTVPGPILPRVGAVDVDEARAFGSDTAAAVVWAVAADHAHRWRAAS